MSKIGVFGGTLNPVHLGHINLITEAKRSFNLDHVVIVPAFQSPHKTELPVSEAHRLKMIELATKDLNFTSIEDYELKNKGKSYTYHTIKFLKEKYKDDELYFIMGEDQFTAFDRWYRYEELLEMVHFIVLKRSTNNLKITAPFLTAEDTIFEVSSSEIRKRILKDDYYNHFVHKDVYHYIEEHGLYE